MPTAKSNNIMSSTGTKTDQILTAVFPVAGMGTRFLPATKSTPKEMLPIVDKPLIQYAAEEAVSAGIDSLVFITNRTKHSISDHFDRAYELEDRLSRAGKQALLQRARQTLPRDVNRLYIPQGEPKGLGHAVGCAESAVGRAFFAVLLADDLILNDELGCIGQMLAIHQQTGASVIAVEQVPQHEISRYGVVAVEQMHNGAGRITSIVEKPAPEDAPSDLGVVGRYILSPRIFDLLKDVAADGHGEIQLTDAIAMLLREEPVYALQFDGRRYDCGHREGFVHATVDVALNDAELGPRLRPQLQAWLNEN